MMTQLTRLLMTCYIITAPTPHHEWVISAAARGFRHFLDDVLNDFSDFFRLSFLLPSLPFDWRWMGNLRAELGEKWTQKREKLLNTVALSDRKCKFCRYTWSQFIDLISNRIIVNGLERSEVPFFVGCWLPKRKSISVCWSMGRDGIESAAQKFMFSFRRFSYRWLGGAGLPSRFFSAHSRIKWTFK